MSFTVSRSLLKLMPIESVMPSNYLILCCPLLLLPSIFPSIRVFSSESDLCIRGQSIGASASAWSWLKDEDYGSVKILVQEWVGDGTSFWGFSKALLLVLVDVQSRTPKYWAEWDRWLRLSNKPRALALRGRREHWKRFLGGGGILVHSQRMKRPLK